MNKEKDCKNKQIANCPRIANCKYFLMIESALESCDTIFFNFGKIFYLQALAKWFSKKIFIYEPRLPNIVFNFLKIHV